MLEEEKARDPEGKGRDGGRVAIVAPLIWGKEVHYELLTPTCLPAGRLSLGRAWGALRLYFYLFNSNFLHLHNGGRQRDVAEVFGKLLAV